MQLSPGFGLNTTQRHRDSDRCEGKCRPIGTEALPEGIITKSSNLEMRPLWGSVSEDFLGDDFAVMLFHYDGVVDKWHDLEWSNRVIHVFIIKEEGLQISQPALDPRKSEVHHPITVRRWRSRVHRRFYKFKGGGRCDNNSTSPPCVGWVEMMAPVFSRAAWRCAWYMIQGDRMVKVGVVDEEYIVHLGLPTLGGFPDKNKAADMYRFDNRSAVRRQSYNEMMTFRKRWNKAVEEDECWIDPFKQRTA
ncbi:UNVERIFIED_CONTAM: hypothetical protein Sradi_2606700 [Sesamum radiatum]|uniref:Uncharacterized protein n=1 Tax=Sesamum radiatum TaxID=300843 RepID=A0AAW2S4C7_SESRA